MKGTLVVSGLAAVAIAAACSSSDGGAAPAKLTQAQLEDPATCQACHAEQFREWSRSMHAYASEDPVFVAMNKRMLRETNGASADFCVGCHAPLAFRKGLTKDGSNLADLPQAMRGVTCYFCHSVDRVNGAHNNPLGLATDGTMRGGISDPSSLMPHGGVHSSLHDREVHDSASMCGACHDVVTPHGANIERTFDEWKASLFAKPGQLTCGKCHMQGRDGQAAQIAGAPAGRRVHDHTMPGVDIALTPFFGETEQRAAVQSLLDATVLVKLCIQQTPLGVTATVNIDNAFGGHGFPSGANQDRRAWVELHAFKDGVDVFSSGAIEDGKAASAFVDPNLWLLRDRIFREDGAETHLFWEAARVEPSQLPAAVTNDPLDPAFNHSVTRTYPLPAIPDRVTTRVRIRPLDFDLLDDLVKSGDLDPSIPAKVPTFDMASGTKEWSFATTGFGCVN